MEIAKTIWTQMNAIDKSLVWAMGTRKPGAIENGLRIKVSGRTHKGLIEIKLNGKDLYDVSLIKAKRSYYANELYGKKRYIVENVAVKTFNDVYVEDLMSLLATEVEGEK
jgi:hypothetical protein